MVSVVEICPNSQMIGQNGNTWARNQLGYIHFIYLVRRVAAPYFLRFSDISLKYSRKDHVIFVVVLMLY